MSQTVRCKKNVFYRGSVKARIVEIAQSCMQDGTKFPPRQELAKILGMSVSRINTARAEVFKARAVVVRDGQVWEVTANIVDPPPSDAPKKAVKKQPTAAEKILALVRHCDNEGIAWPSSVLIAKAIGITRERVAQCLLDLRTAGVIYQAAPNCYRIAENG